MIFDRLIGSYLDRVITSPKTTSNDYYRDSMSVFKQNMENISKAYGGVDIRKPFYGYTLTDSLKLSGDDLLKGGFYLNTVSYYELANAASLIYVRIPHIHGFEKPEKFKNAQEEKFFYLRHTACTLDPTIFRQEMVLTKNKLVKIQFLDDSLTKAVIVGVSNEVHGGLGRLIRSPDLEGQSEEPYPYTPPPGAGAFLGVSTMYNIHHNARKYATKNGYDLNMMWRGCGSQTEQCVHPNGILQEAGMTVPRFKDYLERVLRSNYDRDFYNAFKYVFIDIGRNDSFYYMWNDMDITDYTKHVNPCKEYLKKLFTNPEVKFIMMKPSVGWFSKANDAPGNRCVTEFPAAWGPNDPALNKPAPPDVCGGRDLRWKALATPDFAAQTIRTLWYEPETGQFSALKPTPDANPKQTQAVIDGTFDWSNVANGAAKGGGHPWHGTPGVIALGELAAKIVYGEEIDLNRDFDNLDLFRPAIMKSNGSKKPPTIPWTPEYQKKKIFWTQEELAQQGISTSVHQAARFLGQQLSTEGLIEGSTE